MNFEIGQSVKIHNTKNLPPWFDFTQSYTIHGILRCPGCGKIKYGILNKFGIISWLSGGRFIETKRSKDQINREIELAIANEDYEKAAKLRDEQTC